MQMRMKQFGTILLGLGMMLALSCSKEEDYIATSQQNIDAITPYGIFEGEWQMSKYGRDIAGEIKVDADQIIFDVPVDYLLYRLGLVNEDSKSAYPNEPFFTTTSDYTYYNTTQVMRYSELGFSATSIYIKNESIDNQTMPSGNNALSFYVKADDVDSTISLVGIKEQPTGVFDNITGQWQLAIPIDEVTIFNRKTTVQYTIVMLDEDAPDKSAWLLVFKGYRKK